MKFPLYKNDKKPSVFLNENQKEKIYTLIEQVEKGNLKLIKNNCLCGNTSPLDDVAIAEKDRFGIPIRNLICSKCGLVRSEEIFDKDSNIDFYKEYYRDIYVGKEIPGEDFFRDQQQRGEVFLSILSRFIDLSEANLVAEIGCGAGGILYPFFLKGASCIGVDYNENYLAFGRKKGLELLLGDYHEKIRNESVSILILSHVMEHFTEPIKELQDIIEKLVPEGYLLVEVPGIFYIGKVYLNPILYLQSAHVFNYYYYYLNVFFNKIGLMVMNDVLLFYKNPKTGKKTK
jgi:SAM-dependent methyltransferase